MQNKFFKTQDPVKLVEKERHKEAESRLFKGAADHADRR